MTKKQLAVIIASVVIMIGAITGVIVHKKAEAKKTEEMTSVVETTNIDTEVAERLVVDLGTCHNYDDISRELLWSSLSKMDAQRVKATGFSDAVTFPFESATAAGRLDELREEILRNPVYGDMVARGLVKIVLQGGKGLGEVNPWMKEFIQRLDAAQSAKKVGARGIEIWLEAKKDANGKVIYYVTEEYRSYACGLCVILDRLVPQGTTKRLSEVNFALNDATKDYARRTVEADYQERKEAFVLRYVRKNGTISFEIAFNLLDKRFELLTTPKAPVKKVSTTAPPKTTRRYRTTTRPPTTVKPTTTTKPRPTTTRPRPSITLPTLTLPDLPTITTRPRTTQPTTTRAPRKEPLKDPVFQGNANIGGGRNKPSDGAGTYQPTAARPPETTTQRVVPTTRPTTTSPQVEPGVNLDNATPPTTQYIPPHTDSHDVPGNNAGNSNGEFAMPD